MIQNILLILVLLLFVFLLSHEEKMNEFLYEKKNVKYFFLLFICYCIYQKYTILLFATVTVAGFYFIRHKGELFESIQEKVRTTMEHFDSSRKRIISPPQNKETVIEPFKEEIQKIKEMYDSIQDELKKL